MEYSVKILVVEDEFLILDRIKKTLQSFGYSIVSDAVSADEAVLRLQASPFDLILLDINIKGNRDGIWLANFINENYNTPFIFLTAYGSGEIIKKAISVNPSAYLIKPFHPEQLYAAIEIALNSFNQANFDSSSKNSLIIKIKGLYKKIKVDKILFIEVKGNYLEVNTDDSTYSCRMTLKEIKTLIDESKFFQPHRAFLVNKDKVKSFNQIELFVKNRSIPISRLFRSNLPFLDL